jgi:tetratricopeptide (TPR) repeat protein
MLAREAFENWQAGQRERAKLLYEEAIPLADPQHWALSAYHGEYACVLNELGHHEQATAQLEESLAVELAQGNPEGSSAVTIARYFLAEQFLRQGALDRALAVLAPSIGQAPNDCWTRLAEAHVLFALRRTPEAKAAATLAISNAPTPEKAAELAKSLAHIVEAPDAEGQ